MGNIQVKNIPDDLHERLQRQARKREVSLNEVILSMLESEMERLEIRGEIVSKAGLKITYDPYDLTARILARSNAGSDRVNGSTRINPKEVSFPVENVRDDLHQRLLGQANQFDTDLESFALGALEVALDRVENYERRAARPVKEYSISPSELIARERAQRDAPIDF